MIEIRQTSTYRKWFAALKDDVVRARITVRIRRLSLGNFGDTKSVGAKISELRIDYGPGYRVYYTRRGSELVILLAGGDKKSQARDIAKARILAAEME